MDECALARPLSRERSCTMMATVWTAPPVELLGGPELWAAVEAVRETLHGDRRFELLDPASGLQLLTPSLGCEGGRQGLSGKRQRSGGSDAAAGCSAPCRGLVHFQLASSFMLNWEPSTRLHASPTRIIPRLGLCPVQGRRSGHSSADSAQTTVASASSS